MIFFKFWMIDNFLKKKEFQKNEELTEFFEADTNPNIALKSNDHNDLDIEMKNENNSKSNLNKSFSHLSKLTSDFDT